MYDSTTKEVVYDTITSSILPAGSNYSDYLFWDNNTGKWQVGSTTLHLGAGAGTTGQSSGAIALGIQAGYTGQPANAIAIGSFAGMTNQPANSIILNATGTTMTTSQASALYVNPIRSATGPKGLFYDPTLKEVTYADPTFSNVSLQTYTYAYFQARDAVLGKFMLTDCADKDAFYRLQSSLF
jgi:hypothetical protein